MSLLAVLIPLLFMGDVVGRLFHEFAITLAATIVISAFVSLTLVPMLCAKLLQPTRRARAAHHATGGRFFQALLASTAARSTSCSTIRPIDAARRARRPSSSPAIST